MAWEPDRRSNFFFDPPAHLCAVTYMTEISLIVTLNNQFTLPYEGIYMVYVQAVWRRLAYRNAVVGFFNEFAPISTRGHPFLWLFIETRNILSCSRIQLATIFS